MSLVEQIHPSNEVGVRGDSVAVMDLHRRDVSDEQLHRFEQYAAEMFSAFGMELDSTPLRAGTARCDGRLRG